MIHVGYGTQAELIKLAPVLMELRRRGVVHRTIFTGQHVHETQPVLRHFALGEPDRSLAGGDGVFSAAQAARWAGRVIFDCVTDRQRYRRQIFAPGPGICVVHGDTLSTLLLAILARMLGLKLAHVESGLRSYRWGHPFPEEIVRVLINRRADLLFAPGQWAADNLERMNVPGRIVRLPANTGKDALEYTLAAAPRGAAPDAAYAMVSIHRFETVNSISALRRAVDVVVRAAKGRKIIWPLHTVTRRALADAGLLGEVESAGVSLPDTLPYDRFAPMLSRAEFVIADGGSIQEESFFLDKPCLLLRDATERREGLDENVVLSRWDPATIDAFLADPSSYRRSTSPSNDSPSAIIVDELLALENSLSRRCGKRPLRSPPACRA